MGSIALEEPPQLSVTMRNTMMLGAAVERKQKGNEGEQIDTLSSGVLLKASTP
jgi:hypothetical protein